MSTTTVYNIVKQLQAASGNIEKQAILDANKGNPLFQAYMQQVYDVSINYYQSKLPKGVEKLPAGQYELDWPELEALQRDIAERRVTGKAAVKWLTDMYAAFDEPSRELLSYIIKRSIGASVGDSMVLKTWPDLYFIPPYMRCSSMDDKIKAHYQSLPYFYVQTKRDGSFAYLRKNEDNTADAITRQGSTYPRWFSNKLADGIYPGFVLVGEMEVYEGGKLMSRKDGNGVLNSVAAGADEAEFVQYEFRYVAWDLLLLAEFKAGKSTVTYEERLIHLKHALSEAANPHIELIETHEATSVAEANAIHIDHTKRGLEGTVWKDPNGEWKDSSSGTKYAVKNKVVFEAEYEIVEAYEGEGKAAGMLGGLIVKTKCGKLVTGVGTGFSDKQRKALWLERYALPGLIVTLEANDVILGRDSTIYALSLPVFIEIRTDKTEADTFERVMEQLEAAKFGGSAT